MFCSKWNTTSQPAKDDIFFVDYLWSYISILRNTGRLKKWPWNLADDDPLVFMMRSWDEETSPMKQPFFLWSHLCVFILGDVLILGAYTVIWGFASMEVQKNSWFTMANSTEINDLGLPWSTLIVGNLHIYIYIYIYIYTHNMYLVVWELVGWGWAEYWTLKISS